jgi:LacI family repressor for deo operon, udp, cdd, tsx, nupC, and nupG
VWQDRTAGVRDALCAAGLDLPQGSVVFAGDCFAEDGMRAMQRLLDSSRRLPTAVFCHSDEMAFGALAALRGAGLHCPKDISIAGFDDHPMSRYWGLTTVSQHAHQQGVRAALALIDALSGANVGAERPAPDVPVNLVVRETTGTPPASFTG